MGVAGVTLSVNSTLAVAIKARIGTLPANHSLSTLCWGINAGTGQPYFKPGGATEGELGLIAVDAYDKPFMMSAKGVEASRLLMLDAELEPTRPYQPYGRPVTLSAPQTAEPPTDWVVDYRPFGGPFQTRTRTSEQGEA